MEWNAYVYSLNRNKIEKYNVLQHSYLLSDFTKKDFLNKDIFKEKLLRNLKYYFWSKTEWELILRITEDSHIYLIPWCGCKDPEEVKIDVTNDESFDWVAFIDFVKNKKNIHNEAKIDVFDQINFRIEEFTDVCWNALINNTKKGIFL